MKTGRSKAKHAVVRIMAMLLVAALVCGNISLTSYAADPEPVEGSADPSTNPDPVEGADPSTDPEPVEGPATQVGGVKTE